MISVNLLPEKYRRKDRLPLGAFAALLVGITLAGSSLAYLSILQFKTLSALREERAQIEEDLSQFDAQLKHHGALEAEKADYEKRESKIREIGASRILWAKKFDQFADIVNAGEDAGRYTVWFDDVIAEQAVDTKKDTGGKFEAKGFSGSSNYANMANFFADLEGTEFFRDFMAINNPNGKVTEPSDELVPSQVWEFSLKTVLKAPPGSKKPVPPPKGKAPGKAPSKAPAKKGGH